MTDPAPSSLQSSSSSPRRTKLRYKSKMLHIFLLFFPKVPLIARVALLHILRWSEQAKYIDLRTALTVAVLRSFLTPEKPLSVTGTQKFLGRDPGIKGRIWVSKYTAPAPEGTSIRDALVKVIETLRLPSAARTEVRLPEIAPVEAEWTGYRDGAADDAKLPQISEEDKYHRLMEECTSSVTVLYFHGGAYWLMDPATHRPTTKKLAKLTGGRCYSVRYRLAPQNPFPAALLDALSSYLTLLFPPPGAFHEPVSPGEIVVAGDSAGGNLSLALLQTLLELRRQNLKIHWLGEDREIPLPAGVAVNSPWMDITLSSPSYESNVPYDYIPAPKNGMELSNRPACAAWPAVPPRRLVYADDDLVLHPLVTLLTAPSWAGAPPVYMCTGWELLADEDKFVASKMYRDGVTVVFEEYEAMPHCFAMLFNHLKNSRRCFGGWAGFIQRAVEKPEAVASSFVTVKARTLKEEPIEVQALSPCTEGEMRERLFQKWAEATSTNISAKL